MKIYRKTSDYATDCINMRRYSFNSRRNTEYNCRGNLTWKRVPDLYSLQLYRKDQLCRQLRSAFHQPPHSICLGLCVPNKPSHQSQQGVSALRAGLLRNAISLVFLLVESPLLPGVLLSHCAGWTKDRIAYSGPDKPFGDNPLAARTSERRHEQMPS